MADNIEILNTLKTSNPKQDAKRFSIMLGLEKGYTSKVKRVQGGYMCVASDNRAIFFKKI